MRLDVKSKSESQQLLGGLCYLAIALQINSALQVASKIWFGHGS